MWPESNFCSDKKYYASNIRFLNLCDRNTNVSNTVCSIYTRAWFPFWNEKGLKCLKRLERVTQEIFQTIPINFELREGLKNIFVFLGDFDPPWKLGFPKRKTKIMFICILGSSKHIIFFMKSPIFLVIGDFYAIFYVIFGEFFVGTGDPPPYCDKIPTFMGSSEAN